MKKVVETIEEICNQNDEDYLINHLITRNGKIPAPAVFVIRSGDMYKEGYKFYQTKDGVWLADGVPCEYLAVKFEKIDFGKIDKIVIVDDARTFDPKNMPEDEE